MRKTTASRVLAVQALYQFDLRGEPFLKELADFLKSSSDNAEVIALAVGLFRGCADHADEIDACIGAVAEHWDLSRMAAVDRAILRLGAHELLYRPEVPPKVAIDEAIRLAKKFSTAESGAFVNGILDRIMAAQTGRTGAPGGRKP